jgi:energy-converting hydrogenase Eha subunit C
MICDVTINTQKVAFNALALLYNKFLNQPFGDIGFTLSTQPRDRLIFFAYIWFGRINVATTQIYTHVIGQGFESA